MKSLWTLPAFLLVLCLVGIQGRHIETDDFETHEEEERVREHGIQSMRHHRRPRQNFGYDYPVPFSYDYRRDYGMRQQDEYFTRILKSLDEIISYLRRTPPPPPPQPIYIPYPVVQYRPCWRAEPSSKPDVATMKPDVNSSTTEIPDFTVRWPEMEDDNQNWGLEQGQIPEVDDGNDGSRPISFDPVQPNRPTSRPPPPVEHGSSQAGVEQSTAAPVRRPGPCETAILTCCSLPDTVSKRNCFARYDCIKTFATNRACNPNVIKRVLENFSKAYATNKNTV